MSFETSQWKPTIRKKRSQNHVCALWILILMDLIEQIVEKIVLTIPMHFLKILQILKSFLENIGDGKVVLTKETNIVQPSKFRKRDHHFTAVNSHIDSDAWCWWRRGWLCMLIYCRDTFIYKQRHLLWAFINTVIHLFRKNIKHCLNLFRIILFIHALEY